MPIILKDTDAAYLAGLLDGEGSVSICFREPNKTNREVGQQLAIQVKIAMTDYETIRWVAETTDTLNKVYYHPARRDGHKDQWAWCPNISQAYEILSQCLPYMKTKNRQTEIFLELIEIRRASTRSSRRWTEQQTLVNENLVLNKRGV